MVYLAAGIDAAYYLYSYPYHRIVLKNAIDRVASSPPPIDVKAPMCVHATAMRQTKAGTRLVVHLFNDVNTTGGHALPTDDVPLREEVIPIADIRVTFRPEYRIKSVNPRGRNSPWRRRPRAGPSRCRNWRFTRWSWPNWSEDFLNPTPLGVAAPVVLAFWEGEAPA